MRRRLYASYMLSVLTLAIFMMSGNQKDMEPGNWTYSSNDAPVAARQGGLLEVWNPNYLVQHLVASKSSKSEEQLRLEHWKKSFPFKPIYHSDICHDPAIYNPKESKTWHVPDESEAAIKYHSYKNAIFMHGFMKDFFDNPMRYTKEFEQIYHLLGEIDRNDNPAPVAEIFNDLVLYHKAANRNPSNLITKTMPHYDEETGETGIKEVPLDGRRTWADQMESSRESIAFSLYQEKEWPTKAQMSPEKAWEWADIIIQTIPGEGFLSYTIMDLFGYSDFHEKALEPGDPLLIPKEGYVEAYEEITRKNHRPVLVNRSKDLPAVLVLGEDGQFYDEATGEPFMQGSKPILFEPGQQPVIP